MNREDRFRAASVRGHVRGRWVRGSGDGDTSYPVFDVHNTLTYAAADVLAAAYGGDATRIPKYIGFVYGSNLVQLPPVSRDETLQTIDELCRSLGLNMQVNRFSRPPTVGDYSTFDMDPDKELQYKLVPIYDGEGGYTDWVVTPPEWDGTTLDIFYDPERKLYSLGEKGVGGSIDATRPGSYPEDNATHLEFQINVLYQADREYVAPKIIGYKRVPVDPDDSNDSNDYFNPYDGNVVEFHAVTRSGRAGVYHGDTDESSPYADPLGKDMYIYRAVLLGDGKNPCAGDPYTVLAVADLAKNGSYRQKPKDYELAFDWRVTFE